MVALQASIGALNDVVDAPADAGRKPGKPIPAGLVSPALARGGRRCSAPRSGLVAGGSRRAGLAAARGRDPRGRLRLRPPGQGDALVVAAVRGRDPAAARVRLVRRRRPAARIVRHPPARGGRWPGSALAIANARADLERDMAAGRRRWPRRLGDGRAWAVAAALLGVVLAVALGSLVACGRVPRARLGGGIAAGAIVAIGVAIGRRPATPPARRERAWEIEAVGVALARRRVAGGPRRPGVGASPVR